MSALTLMNSQSRPTSLVSRLAGSGLWYWLAACLLAWLTAHALAGAARLIWPGTTDPASAAQVTIDPGSLPVVPTGWGASASLADPSIPITDLPYSVVGQVLAETPGTSLVVLATPSGQRTLMAGDAIESAIAIERIDTEGVIFSRQGQLERLPWPDKNVSDDPITRVIVAPAGAESAPAAPQDRSL